MMAEVKETGFPRKQGRAEGGWAGRRGRAFETDSRVVAVVDGGDGGSSRAVHVATQYHRLQSLVKTIALRNHTLWYTQ